MTLNLQIGMVNVGSKEQPLWVPEKALSDDKETINRFWGMVAAGGISLNDEQKDYLLGSQDE